MSATKKVDERDAARAEAARLRGALKRLCPCAETFDGPALREMEANRAVAFYSVAGDIVFALEALAATDSAPWLREKLTRVATAAVEAQRREHQTAEDIAAIVDAEVSR